MILDKVASVRLTRLRVAQLGRQISIRIIPPLEFVMRVARLIVVTGAVLTCVTACVTPAPGADKVRITKAASDVSSCTAVGNLKVPRNAGGNVDIANAETEFRNQTVGLGGNTAFETSAALGVPVEGIAYRCP
jgi:hypothetical protein